MSGTNPLTAARLAALNSLNFKGLVKFDHIPAVPQAPGAIVMPASTYITHGDGNVFGEWDVQLVVSVLTSPGPNNTSTKQLDNLLVECMTDLTNAGFIVSEIPTIYLYEVQQRKFMAADILISQSFRL